jgi:hypothetical protein
VDIRHDANIHCLYFKLAKQFIAEEIPPQEVIDKARAAIVHIDMVYRKSRIPLSVYDHAQSVKLKLCQLIEDALEVKRKC